MLYYTYLSIMWPFLYSMNLCVASGSFIGLKMSLKLQETGCMCWAGDLSEVRPRGRAPVQHRQGGAHTVYCLPGTESVSPRET